MKKNILSGIVLVLVLATSCKKYLTVTPKTQVAQDVLFETESGFKDALTGVYIQMRNNNSYGMSLTQSTIESLCSSWDVTSGSTEQNTGLFNYTDAGVQNAFSAIWGQQYTTIASINAILAQIDENKSVFKTAGLYELVKGECLGLRAYIHLDVLRLFGPVPTAATAASILPYVTSLSTTPANRISFAAYQTALNKDLTEAEILLKSVDPIVTAATATDSFFSSRYLRMNYYALKALQARSYLWFSDTAKAFECARLVIDAGKFRLGTAADLTAKDYALTPEHVFGLYDFDMYSDYISSYGLGVYYKGSTATTIKSSLYGNTGSDIREINLWEILNISGNITRNIIKKYKVDANTTNLRQIPMLRLSELYLIAAETAPYAQGIDYFKTFRTSRNIGNLTVPANAAALQTEIIKEYRKEFYAEGQGFYCYKRLNVGKTSFLFVPTAATINYVIPLPGTETI